MSARHLKLLKAEPQAWARNAEKSMHEIVDELLVDADRVVIVGIRRAPGNKTSITTYQARRMSPATTVLEMAGALLREAGKWTE